MDVAELTEAFRSEVYDLHAPYLWSDADVLRYASEAESMFCRLSGGVADSTTQAITRIPYEAGDEFVKYDPRILVIRAIRHEESGREVRILNVEDVAQLAIDTDYGIQRGFRLDNTPGEVRFVVTNMEPAKLRLVRIPSHAGVLRMTVYRRPLARITDLDGTLEIPEEHHNSLLWWMKALAYQKDDTETRDPKRVAENETRFVDYCAQVRAEREKREHKVRVVHYGGL